MVVVGGRRVRGLVRPGRDAGVRQSGVATRALASRLSIRALVPRSFTRSYRIAYLSSRCVYVRLERRREREREGGSCSKEGRRGGLILEAAGWRLVDRCNRYVDVFCVLRAMFGGCMGLGNGMGNGKGRSKFSKRREIDVTGAGCRSERPVALHRFSPFCVVDARILNNLRSRIIRFLS